MNCVCCNSDNISIRGQKIGFTIYKCSNCKFEFVYPIPSNEELEKFYNTGMHRNLNDRIKKGIDDIDNSKNHPHRDWFLKIINKAKKITGKEKLNILELGASMGSFVHLANKLGHHAVGTEVSEETANASKGIIQGEVIYTGSRRYDEIFQHNSFDFIYLEHVLEHLTNPSDIIEQLNKLLKENGVLIISVPNQNSWMAKLYGMYWDWTSPPLHLYYFNSNNLNLLLKQNNFTKVESWTGEYYFRSIYQFFISALFVHRFKQIMNKIFKTKFKTVYYFEYAYIYPRNIKQVFSILPYYLMCPFVKLMSSLGKGNDLTIIVKKQNK